MNTNEKNVTKENESEHEAAKRSAEKINRRQTMLAIGAGVLTVVGLCLFGYYINK